MDYPKFIVSKQEEESISLQGLIASYQCTEPESILFNSDYCRQP